MAVVGETGPVEHKQGELESELGFWDSVVMAVAGSAPAYSIGASTALIVSVVGFGAPGALLWCGIPMMGIAIAYHQLNQMGANAGAAYAWVGRVLHPFLGFLTGWALVVSATIFMVSATLPAGQATLSLFSQHLAGEAGWATLAAACWFLVMAYFVARGVRVTANAQWIMSSVEIGLLLIFGILGLLHGHKQVSFSMGWLGFGHFGSFSGFVAGALVAAFYYWGWDVSSNLGEETGDSEKSSGMGGIIGVVIVFLLFELFTIAINMNVPAKEIQSSTTNVLVSFGNIVWSGPGGKLMIIALMLSTVATLETTLIQVTRSLFSMGRERTLPLGLSRIHPEWKTPVVATATIVLVSLPLFALSSLIGSVNSILTDAIDAIGLQIAVYYGLAGFAAVVGFRRLIFKSVSNFIFMGAFPLIGGCFMVLLFFESIFTPGNLTPLQLWLGLGTLLIGLIPLIYYYLKGSAYLHEKPTLGGADITQELPTAGTL